MLRSDDPIADFNAWDDDQQTMLDRLPKCSYCEEPIQDDYCYEINDELICEECLKEHHRKWTEDYTE